MLSIERKKKTEESREGREVESSSEAFDRGNGLVIKVATGPRIYIYGIVVLDLSFHRLSSSLPHTLVNLTASFSVLSSPLRSSATPPPPRIIHLGHPFFVPPMRLKFRLHSSASSISVSRAAGLFPWFARKRSSLRTLLSGGHLAYLSLRIARSSRAKGRISQRETTLGCARIESKVGG